MGANGVVTSVSWRPAPRSSACADPEPLRWTVARVIPFAGTGADRNGRPWVDAFRPGVLLRSPGQEPVATCRARPRRGDGRAPPTASILPLAGAAPRPARPFVTLIAILPAWNVEARAAPSRRRRFIRARGRYDAAPGIRAGGRGITRRHGDG